MSALIQAGLQHFTRLSNELIRAPTATATPRPQHPPVAVPMPTTQKTAAALVLLSCCLALCTGASASSDCRTPTRNGCNAVSLRNNRPLRQPSLELCSSESDLRELSACAVPAGFERRDGVVGSTTRSFSRSGRPFKLSRTVELP